MARPSPATRAACSTRTAEARSSSGLDLQRWSRAGVLPVPAQRRDRSIHPVPHDVGSYFDFSPNDEAVRVRTELMAALTGMGLEVEMGHHEVALGQHEIDFRFDDALRTADNVLTLKYTVKAIAAQHGSGGFVHAQADLRHQRLGHALPPIAVRSRRQEPVL